MRTLLFISMMFVVLFARANPHDVSDSKLNLSNDTGYFAYMPRPEWLVIGSETGDVEMEVHLPRIRAISELTWSRGNRYLAFTAKDRELWLFDLQQATLRLLESAPASHPKVRYLPKWSPQKHRLLFISHKQTQSRPRIYAPERKHSYALPLLANEAASLAWNDENNVIAASDFTGNTQRIAAFNTLGITIEHTANHHLTASNH